MELIFFLVILGIQFVYQIYLAINKKRRRLKEKSEESVETSDSYGFLQESSENLESQVQDFPEFSQYDKESGDVSSQPDDRQAKSLYDQLFGFIEEPDAGLKKSQEAFSYDDEVEEELSTEFDLPSSQVTELADRSVKKSPEPPHVVKKNIISTQIRIRRKLRNPRNFKDSWRIKFVLDRPGGLLRERTFF